MKISEFLNILESLSVVRYTTNTSVFMSTIVEIESSTENASRLFPKQFERMSKYFYLNCEKIEFEMEAMNK